MYVYTTGIDIPLWMLILQVKYKYGLRQLNIYTMDIVTGWVYSFNLGRGERRTTFRGGGLKISIIKIPHLYSDFNT